MSPVLWPNFLIYSHSEQLLVYAHKLAPRHILQAYRTLYHSIYPILIVLSLISIATSLFFTLKCNVFIKFCNQNNRWWYLVHIIRNFHVTPKQNGTQDKTQFLFWLSFVLWLFRLNKKYPIKISHWPNYCVDRIENGFWSQDSEENELHYVQRRKKSARN